MSDTPRRGPHDHEGAHPRDPESVALDAEATRATDGTNAPRESAAFDSQATAETGGAGTSLAAGGLWSDAWLELRRSPLFWTAALLITFVLALTFIPGVFATQDPNACSLSRSLLTPSADHWFGTDLQGCDYYSRVIFGARNSVAVGVIVVLLFSAIALVFGSLAGYYGGWVDALIARVTDIIFALPLVLGGLVLLTVLPGVEIFGYTLSRNVPTVAVVISVFAWPAPLRLLRGSTLATAQADYVLAARALGASDLRIMRRHVLPNAITPLLVYATIGVGLIIVAEAVLTFLGVGLQLPTISWGLMISGARTRFAQYPHLLLFPGLFLSITVFAFILMGDALRDAFDPKLR